MDGEDPPERPDYVKTIINGLERYNPEAVGTLETYLQQQCEEKYCDCNANRTLLKLYQLNPDRIKDEVITNILVKAMTQFPSAQFDLAMHLLSPSIALPSSHNKETATSGAANPSPSAGGSELAEAVSKLRALNGQLEAAQYARFWATLDSDDLYADLTTDIAGFEELIRVRIAQLIGQASREVAGPVLEAWLGMDDADTMRRFVTETCGWRVREEDGTVLIPPNPDNEAKKSEIREDVNVDMFARVIRRSWEEAA